MTRPRISETDHGIQGEFDVAVYDRFLRGMRNKGWMETDLIVKFGIQHGLALEVGPGPGYLGLEWLKKTTGTQLKGLEISPAMIQIAERNAKEYGFADRVQYVKGDAQAMPFDNDFFDGVFTNGSLHEWSQPRKILNEIYRVLKPGGKYFISDLRRDMNPLVEWLMKLVTQPKEIKPGLITSINAAYTPEEITALLREMALKEAVVASSPMGLVITGEKNAR
ncbi:MAG: class I SAM-dependent methyltransferase [Anaerolineales bacterium]|nr:class I SAM-dependent methyltransferase [Anaerolineales bacterium]